MKSIEIISLKRVAITKRDLLLLNKWDEYVEHFCAGYTPEQEDEDYFFLDEITAHTLGLISDKERYDMLDFNSRVTLRGVKKYHWKELANTESTDGTWDITFNLNDLEDSKHEELKKKLEDIREQKNSIVRSQRYEEAAKLRDTEKQLLTQMGEPKVSFSIYDEDKVVATFKVSEAQFEELIDLIKRIA